MSKIFDNTTRLWFSIIPAIIVTKADIAEVGFFWKLK